MPAVDVSIVIASRNEGAWLRRTVEAFDQTRPVRAEVIVVDDASVDGSTVGIKSRTPGVKVVRLRHPRGAAEARNVGAGLASGAHLVFSDAHVIPDSGWFPPLRAALTRPTTGVAGPAIVSAADPACVGFGHTWADRGLQWEWLRQRESRPYPVPFVPAGFLAIRREVWERYGGFDPQFRIWGSIGDELSLRYWLKGADNYVVPSVRICHVFRQRPPYRVDWAEITHNTLRLALLHLSPMRVRRIATHLQRQPGFAVAWSRLAAGDVRMKRASYRKARSRTDDGFMRRFGIDALEGEDSPGHLGTACDEALGIVLNDERDDRSKPIRKVALAGPTCGRDPQGETNHDSVSHEAGMDHLRPMPGGGPDGAAHSELDAEGDYLGWPVRRAASPQSALMRRRMTRTPLPQAESRLTWSPGSMTPAGLHAVCAEVARREPRVVVECGSGFSTVEIARALRRLGGRLVSLEHDAGWAARVQNGLAEAGLADAGHVVLAALEPHPLTLDGSYWYAEKVLRSLPSSIDLLLVDGPPACTRQIELSRYPALPALADCLSPSAAVILDDIHRPGELEVVERWEREYAFRFELRRAERIAIGHRSCAGVTRVPSSA